MKDNRSKPWVAKIAIDGKTQYLGTYATEEEAARAFDAKAAKHGRKLNFPDEWEDVEDIEEEEEEEEEEEGGGGGGGSEEGKRWRRKNGGRKNECGRYFVASLSSIHK